MRSKTGARGLQATRCVPHGAAVACFEDVSLQKTRTMTNARCFPKVSISFP